MKSKKKKVDEKNKTSGITLIALVITIIVLLILAGVALASLSGENGLLNRSNQAKEEALKAQLKEEIEMAIMDIQAEELPKGNNVTLESLAGEDDENAQLENHKDLQEGNITADLGEEEITGEYKGYNYKIDENLNVIIEDKIQGITFNYKLSNNGEYTNQDIILTINASSTNGKITEIQSPEGINKNDDGTYTITKNGEYEFIVKDETGATRTRTININKIDKLNPEKVDISVELQNGLTITVDAKDAEANNESCKSEIGKYEYYIKSLKDSEFAVYVSNDNKYNVANINMNTTYTIYVIAYDKAGNSIKSSEIKKEVNLWTASASSEWGGYPPSKAFDGDETGYSYWHTKDGVSMPQWLKFDSNFGAVYVDKVYISFSNPSSSFKIQGSNDDQYWETLGSYTDSDISDAKTYELEKTDTAYSKFRIYFERRR